MLYSHLDQAHTKTHLQRSVCDAVCALVGVNEYVATRIGGVSTVDYVTIYDVMTCQKQNVSTFDVSVIHECERDSEMNIVK